MNDEEILELQMAEVELLEAAYENELDFETKEELELMRTVANGTLKCLKLTGLVFSLKFDEYKLWLSIPGKYPQSILTVRFSSKNFDDSNLQSDLDVEIRSIHEQSNGEEIYISQIIEWINDNITSYKLKTSPTKASKKAPKEDITFARYWIYSHHIYSNEKRRNMAQLSDELGLHGFVLPGKPGIICVEGVVEDVQEFYSHIRRWNWQHLELKHEERKIIKSKELDQNINFEKVSELKFKVTGLRQNHQDLGEFRKYLEERNCGSIFKILFNVG